ncbi:MAG: hypothetical protein ACPGJS_21710 [Flammeovirgaceae bacterium]
MKRYTYFVLCFLWIACNQAEHQKTTDATDKSEAKKELTEDSDASTSTTTLSTDVAVLMQAFPKKWQQLTNENKEFVFYEPCDAKNPQINFTKQADGSYQLQYLSGQEGMTFEVVAMKKWEEPFADEVETYYALEFVSGDTQMKVKVNFSEAGKAAWTGDLIGMSPRLFAPESHFKKYPTLHSPCLECFGPEECTEAQDWGIGILQPIFKENINLYNFKGDAEPAKKIEFSNAMIANYSELRAWSNFESFAPDYDIFYIRCLAEVDGWYKIVANAKNKRVMWVKKSPKVRFLTWEEYLKSTLDLTVADPKSNPFRVGKGTGKMIETQCTGGFKVIAVEGTFAKVIQNELTTECESGKPLQTEGWIQWRDENNYLVRVSWIM